MIASVEAGAQSMLAYLNPRLNWQWESNVLSETPGYRLVAHYTFRSSAENQTSELIETVGKFFANKKSGHHCYLAMRAIFEQLKPQENPPLAIPEPLFYDQANQLLTLKWVAYRPFLELLSDPNYEDYFRLAGHALAHLHKLPIGFGEIKTFDNHVSDLMTPHPLTLAYMMPALNSRIIAILQQLQYLAANAVMPFQPVSLHRDFHLRQLFSSHDKVWLIDWDMYALGDPALDIGNFLVYLATRIPEQAEKAGAAFLEGYQQLQPSISYANINLYKAFTYLRLACKAFRLQATEWEIRADQFLTLCEKQMLVVGK